MAFTYVTLTASEGYRYATGDVPVMRVRATPYVEMTNGTKIINYPVVIPFDAAGNALKSLAATTDPGTVPADNVYRFRIEAGGKVVRSFLAAVPHDAGATVDIDDLAELEEPPELVATFLLADAADVSSTTPADEQVLAYDTTTGQWRPSSVSSIDGALVVNESGADVDTRIEGDTDANLLFVDASTDRVGIGTNAPGAKLDVRGSLVVNEDGADVDTRIEGDTDANLVFVDASTDRVGIGTATPGVKLDVQGTVTSTAAPSSAAHLTRKDYVDTEVATRAATSHTHAAADVTSGTVATARLGSGTADSTTFLRGDQTWATPAGGGASTVYHALPVAGAIMRTSAFPAPVQANGTNIPVRGLAFDGATEEACFFTFRAIGYGSGNLTLDVYWYADSGTSGDVIWGAAIACITANTDSQDVETDSLATASTVTDSHLGTTAQRLHHCAITISNLDSLAANDIVSLRFYRDADAAGDTLNSVDAIVTNLVLSYSTT